MATMKIKRGDMVKVIAGKDKGKEGKVIRVDREKGRVIVEGINMVSKHTKPSAQNQQGGIINVEAPIDASNVMLLVDGKPVRVGFQVEYKEVNGRQKRGVKRVAKNEARKVID